MLNSMLGGGGYYMGGNGLLAPNNSSDYVIRLNQPSTREYWTPENRTNESVALFRNQQIATDIYQSRGFVRLQDVSLMYTFDKKLLQKTGVNPEDIDCVIVSTSTPDYHFPSVYIYWLGRLGS